MAGIRKFGWLSTPSAWKHAEAWRQRRAIYTARELDTGNIFNSVFLKAKTDQSEGLAKLAATAAAKRIQAAAKAKFDEIANLKLDKTV
jgi:hypothetical protein